MDVNNKGNSGNDTTLTTTRTNAEVSVQHISEEDVRSNTCAGEATEATVPGAGMNDLDGYDSERTVTEYGDWIIQVWVSDSEEGDAPQSAEHTDDEAVVIVEANADSGQEIATLTTRGGRSRNFKTNPRRSRRIQFKNARRSLRLISHFESLCSPTKPAGA